MKLEIKMGITKHWDLTCPEYQATIKYICKCKYHLALNKLHKLVMLHLFELYKLNLSQTGVFLSFIAYPVH